MAPTKKTGTSYSKDDLLEAVAEVRMKILTTRQAGRKYGIPQSTIMDRVEGRYAAKPLKSGEFQIVVVLNKVHLHRIIQ